jgi:hypothetical protein
MTRRLPSNSKKYFWTIKHFFHVAFIILHIASQQLGLSMIMVPPLKHEDSLLGLPNSPFSSFFPWHFLHFTIFSHVKWNNFVPNFMWALKISIVFTYESENSKIYPMWAMFYQCPKIPKNLTFWNFLHYNRAFGSYHIHTFYIQ